jgi:cytochrome P450
MDSLTLDGLDLAATDLFHGERHERVFDHLRREDAVHYQHARGCRPAFWNVTRFEDVMAVDTNHAVYSSRNSSFMEDMPEDFLVSMFLAMDPPRHTAYRDAVRPAFTAAHVATLGADIRTRTAAILDALPVGEAFDWVGRVSIDLTSHVLASLFAFPVERRHKLVEWSDLAVLRTAERGGAELDWEARKAEFIACLQEFDAIRRARAGRDGIDLVSLLASTHAPTPLKPSDFLGNLLMLMFAGNDTTRNSITGGVVAFDRFPAQWRRLRADPQRLLPGALQEIFRWQSPVAYMRRTAVVDAELGGKRIKAGDKVVIWYASGNRDDAVFPDPHAFDIERRNAGKHLAFGHGVHRCIGLRLAELQLRILWEEVLARFERIEVLAPPVPVDSTFIKGYSRLMVRVHPRREDA